MILNYEHNFDYSLNISRTIYGYCFFNLENGKQQLIQGEVTHICVLGQFYIPYLLQALCSLNLAQFFSFVL